MNENPQGMTTYEKKSLRNTLIGFGVLILIALFTCGVNIWLKLKESQPEPVKQDSSIPPDAYNPDLQQQAERHYNLTIVASKAAWQKNEIEISKNEWAVVTTYPYEKSSNSISIYSPSVGFGTVGAGGYKKTAGRTFKKPGAPEGCLLMLTGETNVTFWTQDVEQITVKDAGRISFAINDDTTGNGLGLSNDYNDNTGAVTVAVAIIPKPKQ